MIKLSKRLNTIKNMVVDSTSVADIGADHGYLICSLLLDDVIKNGQATENKKGPFNHLQETINQYNLGNKITAYYGDGILPLKENVDTIVIAGMGTSNIIEILSARLDYVNEAKYLICDSHTNEYDLRKFMMGHGFIIDDEISVFENKIYYEVIRFKKGKTKYSELELKYGPILIIKKDDIFKQKYHLRIDKINNLLKENLSVSRKEELNKELEEIKSILD